GERELLAERVAEPRLLDRVAVELADIHRDHRAVRVVPRTVADAIARVDRAGALRAQVRMPRYRRAASRGRAELLTVRVGAGQTAVIGAIALGDAGNEERHRLRRRRGLLREREIRSRHDRHRESQEYQSHPFHIHHLFIYTTS